MSRSGSVFVLVVGVALAGRAAAQTFPPDNAFVPFTCGNGPMIDGVNDTPNATGPLDLVGNDNFPAGFHAADAQFLYLRLRLAGSPLVGNNTLANAAWGFEFDLDGDRSTYELLINVAGIAGAPNQVGIFTHPKTTTPNDPADPSAAPAVFTYPFGTHGRAIPANSTLSGATDAFLDIAVPWSDLASVGLLRDTPVYVWAGSSLAFNDLDLDLACFGGAGGTLSGIDVGRTTPDPNAGGGGTGGAGGGGNGGTGGAGGRVLQGGLGCSVSPTSGAASSLAVVFIFAIALAARRRYLRSSR